MLTPPTELRVCFRPQEDILSYDIVRARHGADLLLLLYGEAGFIRSHRQAFSERDEHRREHDREAMDGELALSCSFPGLSFPTVHLARVRGWGCVVVL